MTFIFKISGRNENMKNKVEKISVYPVLADALMLPYYVSSIGIDDQFCFERPNGYYHTQIYIFTEGKGEISAKGKSYSVMPYYACYLPKNTPHKYYHSSKKFKSWWISFGGYDVERLFEIFKINDFCVFNIQESNKLLHIIEKIYNCLIKDKLYGNYYASAMLYEFFVEFYKCTKKLPNKKISNKSLEKVISFIENEYSNKITLNTLCKVSQLSEGYLCRLFKQYFNMRPLEYLNKKRIQQSKILLNTSHLSIETIAENVGFNTPSYYTKLFRINEGMTPSEFRTLISNKKQ